MIQMNIPVIYIYIIVYISRKLASASWSLLALASIPGAAQGHHVIFHAKGGDPPVRSTLGGYIASQEAMDQY